jgi:cell division septal protein FtsQ
MNANTRHRKKKSWHRELRFLLSFLGIIAVLIICWQGYLFASPYLQKTEWPIKHRVYPSQLKHQDPNQLNKVIQQQTSLGILKTDVSELRKAIQILPWIQHVVVKRTWFNQLSIYITEHHPIVGWQNLEKTTSGFFSDKNEFFSPDNLNFFQEFNSLPLLSSSATTKEAIFKQWLWLKRFTDKNNFKITYVTLDKHHAWRVKLIYEDKPLLLLLGRNNIRRRIQRFNEVFSTIRKQKSSVNQFDLRYTNGISTQVINFTEIRNE